MPVKCEEYNKICVMTADGDLAGDDVANVRALATDRIENRQIVQFVLDLEKTPFVDSEGLEALLWLKRQCEDRFGQLKLAAPDENVRKILEITRLEHRFECAADLPDDDLPAAHVPKLFATYLRYGAKVCGRPALDRAFGTVDFFVLFDVDAMDPFSRRAFFGE